MSADIATLRLGRVEGQPHLRGLGGMIRAELRRWFPLRVIVLAAAGIAAQVLVFVLWSVGEDSDRLAGLLYPLVVLWLAVLILATLATTQGAVASEIEEGTAAWLVAKPIGRPAFVLAKFLAAIPAVLVGMVGLPGIVARLLLESGADQGITDFGASQVIELLGEGGGRLDYTTLPAMPRYLSLLALMATLVLLMVAVTIFFGCVTTSRAAVLLLGAAVPIGLLLVGQLAPDNIADLTPGSLLGSIVDTVDDDPAPALAPILVSSLWIAVILGGAVWLFSRREL